MTSPTTPGWVWELLGCPPIPEGGKTEIGRTIVQMQDGILRAGSATTAAQTQTSQAFGFKWARRETFESPASLRRMKAWLVERYGDPQSAEWMDLAGSNPIVLDAGCGAGMSALELWGPIIPNVRYLAVDISTAVDVAASRFAERGLSAGFMQADLCQLPLPAESLDIIFSEGVLHHTDSTEAALSSLAPLLKPGGRFLFYVYRRKGPVREFTDDYIREKLQAMSQEEAWKAIEPLTELGIALGNLGAEIEVREPINLLGIPAGRYDIQRLFYWHIAKAFYHADLHFDEMAHINYDWYAPKNAHRQSPEEVRAWCAACGLAVEEEKIEDSGITVIAKKS
jgi:arsenite methyltransferase